MEKPESHCGEGNLQLAVQRLEEPAELGMRGKGQETEGSRPAKQMSQTSWVPVPNTKSTFSGYLLNY